MRKEESGIPISSFARTLTRRILAVLVVMIAVSTAVVYGFVKARMAEEARERYQGLLQQTSEQIRRVLSDVYVGTVNSVYDVERDISDPDKMYGHVERIVQQNPRMVGCGVMFEANYYPKKGHWYEVYAVRDTTDSIRVRQIGSEKHDYLDADWFVSNIAKDEGDWTVPYFDNAGAQQLLITYVTPIHDRNGKNVGLLGADVALGWLREKLEDIDNKNNLEFENSGTNRSYSFIIDRNGTYIIHPDSQRILLGSFLSEAKITPDTLDDALVRRMMAGERGDSRLTVDGVSSRIFYRPMKYTQWSMAIVVPEKTIYRNGRALGLIILATMLLGLLAIYLISKATIKRTSKPLTDYAAQAASVEKELKIAHDIQMAMLPSVVNSAPDVYATLTPAREVGGDFYDIHHRDGKLFFCIGDVSGKGVPAALVMAMAQNAFRMLVNSESAPDRIVSQMNESLARDNTYCIFITLFVGVIDLSTGLLRYCNAGHKAPMTIQMANGVQEKSHLHFLQVDSNFPVGAMSDWDFTAQETHLSSGTILFLYTDGLNEAENVANELFGRDRMEEVIRSMEAPVSPKCLIETMTTAVHDFVGDMEQSDDLTMIAIRYR
jgi:sigma-B regulation protein RsbU (phosphoserine phosphatase)